MITPFSVTTATSTHEYAEILPLVHAHIEYEKSAVRLSASWATRTTELVAANKLTIFIARIAHEPVGYASVTTDVATWTGEDFTHIDCVFVAEDHRGAGIGRLLIESAVENARSHNHQELQWQTPDWNTPAIRFYKKLGAAWRHKMRFTLDLK